MAVGSVQSVLVCVAADVGQAPCPAGTAPAVVQAYVLDASQAASIEAQYEPFDYAKAAEVWGFAFTFVVSLYLVAKASGIVLNRIKS